MYFSSFFFIFIVYSKCVCVCADVDTQQLFGIFDFSLELLFSSVRFFFLHFLFTFEIVNFLFCIWLSYMAEVYDWSSCFHHDWVLKAKQRTLLDEQQVEKTDSLKETWKFLVNLKMCRVQTMFFLAGKTVSIV